MIYILLLELNDENNSQYGSFYLIRKLELSVKRFYKTRSIKALDQTERNI